MYRGLVNNHPTFYLSYLGMNYSNVIGFLTFIVFLLQFLSGPLLSRYYSPFLASSSANVASNNLITIDFSLNNPLVQFHMPLNSFSSITDRMQPVFNDFNPTHVTFYLLNKQTLSSIFLRRG